MIPTIMTSQEIIDKAFRRIVKVDVESAESKLEMVREKSLGRLNSATDTITEVLIKYHHAFPSVNKKEGFLMCVVIDMNRLKQALSKLQWATKKIRDLRRIYMIKIKEARNLDELDTVRKQFYGRMCSVVNRLEADLKFMAAAREEFRKIPMVEETMPTVVIAGFPNVGKSQLVERISTARPEIAPYPFTTQGIGVGHFSVGWRRFQVIDTPGLLDRPLEERNAIELQAVLALKYLADVIVFVLDPSETSGYFMDQQMNLLRSVRENFPDIQIIEVENKVDLLRSGSDRLKMSAANGEGTDALVEVLVRTLVAIEKESYPQPSD
jgi:nucleolar GTP-binding protein